MRRRLPEFGSERELLRFLDDPAVDLSASDLATVGEATHVDIDEETLRHQEETEYSRPSPLRPVTMRLDQPLVRALKRIASRKGMPYQTLARVWLRDRAIEELQALASRRPSRRRATTRLSR